MANVTATAVPGDLTDTSSRQGSIITAFVLMFTMATIVVCLRFYTRRMILRIFGIEDWLIMVALVSGSTRFVDLVMPLVADRRCVTGLLARYYHRLHPA